MLISSSSATLIIQSKTVYLAYRVISRIKLITRVVFDRFILGLQFQWYNLLGLKECEINVKSKTGKDNQRRIGWQLSNNQIS